MQDLRGYLEEITGVAPRVDDVMGSAPPAWRSWSDRSPLSRSSGDVRSLRRTDGDGYILKSVGTRWQTVSGGCRGVRAHGTKYAVARLMKSLRAEEESALIDSPVDMASTPAFAKRGMHFNGWAFGYPYTFRGWREEDWQRYLDILSYQGINLFYLWPFIEIMPVPLSERTGPIWKSAGAWWTTRSRSTAWKSGSCSARTAWPAIGAAWTTRDCRPYWRPSQEDLNPGNPEHFRPSWRRARPCIASSTTSTACATSTPIPGAYAGSPLSDYVKVLRGCRDLLDRHNMHGKQAKLINWMWFGWGAAAAARVRPGASGARRIESLRQELPEPWWLVSGTFRVSAALPRAGRAREDRAAALRRDRGGAVLSGDQRADRRDAHGV